MGADPQSVDPRFVADDEGQLIVDALFDSLVRLDDELEVVPAAAESWEVSDDATKFVFRLRPDATFHDGTPVTAQHFVRAFNRMADGTAEPRSFVAYQLAPVRGFEAAQREGEPLSGLEAVDEHTLRIVLSEPFAEFVGVLADPSLAPVPPSADDDPEQFGRQPIGNGPFQLSGEWARGEFVRVARYDDYSGGRALLDEVVFQIYANDPDQESQYAAFEDDRLHVAEVPAGRLEEALELHGSSADGYTGPGVLDGATTTLYYYGFNTQRAPFDDPDVRRALSLLIDRDAIVADITNETRQVADAIVAPQVPGYQPEVCVFCAYDPDRALELWRGDGGDGDEEPPSRTEGPLTILHNSGRTHRAIAERVARSIEETLDVEVETESRELSEFVQTLRAGEMGIFRLGWQADHPSPGSYLHPLFSSDEDNLDNLTRYRNPDVDQLLDSARAATDTEERLTLYQEAERIVLEDAAVAPIFVYRHHRVVAPDVRDFRMGPLGDVDLTRVWLDPTA